MENSYRFFENKECQYFPCHEGCQDFNCLFCYCPMYLRKKCLGQPRMIQSKRTGRMIKDCSGCNYPHVPEHYDAIMELLRQPEEE